MKFYLETERLILRDILPTDDESMFELDANPAVHRYLGNRPIQDIERARTAIANIRQQYQDNGIGRWATIEKATGAFIGWSGLKFITENEGKNNQSLFYDVGYRFIPKFWGKGYATECTKTALQYGFEEMKLQEIVGTCHEENKASRRVLEKCGLRFKEQYIYNNELTCDWLSISKEEWANMIYDL